MPPKSGLKGGAKRGAQKIDKKRQKLQDRRDGSKNKTKPGQGLMAQLKAPAPPKLEDLQQKMRARQSAKKELQRERVVAHQRAKPSSMEAILAAAKARAQTFEEKTVEADAGAVGYEREDEGLLDEKSMKSVGDSSRRTYMRELNKVRFRPDAAPVVG